MTGREQGGCEPREVSAVFHETVLGGATLSVTRLVPLLEDRGWRFRFWAPRPSPLFEELRARGLPVEGAPRPVAYSLAALRLPPGAVGRLRATPGYVRSFRSWLRASRVDVLHANSLLTLVEATAATRLGVPILFHVHEMLPSGPRGRIARSIAHRLPGEVVGVSQACAARLAGGGKPVRVVYESAPIPDRPPHRFPRPGHTVVGTVGVVSTRKGSDVFVEAARLVREREPGVEFRMVGAATDELEVAWAERLLGRAGDLGIVTEHRADVPARLAEWDVFVLPSRSDPFPISMLEAMGSGLAAIGTEVDGIAEQLTPETGILVPPDDPRSLADAIVALHRDPGRRAELGAAARARVLASFTLEHQAAGLHEAYLAALRAQERRWRCAIARS